MKFLTTLFSSLLLSLALAGAAFAGESVNINTADAATIDRVLLNVGPAKAQAIVDYRKANGAFRSPEQLALVKGIGLKTVEKNRDRIVVGAARPAAARPGAAMAKAQPRPAPKPVARRGSGLQPFLGSLSNHEPRGWPASMRIHCGDDPVIAAFVVCVARIGLHPHALEERCRLDLGNHEGAGRG